MPTCNRFLNAENDLATLRRRRSALETDRKSQCEQIDTEITRLEAFLRKEIPEGSIHYLPSNREAAICGKHGGYLAGLGYRLIDNNRVTIASPAERWTNDVPDVTCPQCRAALPQYLESLIRRNDQDILDLEKYNGKLLEELRKLGVHLDR